MCVRYAKKEPEALSENNSRPESWDDYVDRRNGNLIRR